MKKNLLYLQLFDGEGGGAPAGAENAAGTEGTGGTLPVANQRLASKRRGKTAVVYGKAPEEDGAAVQIEKTQEAEQNPPSEQVEQITQTEQPDRKKAFEELIKGEYKDVFHERMQSALNERFKETKSLRENQDKLAPMLSLLESRYGIKANDLDGLVKAIEEDNSFYEEEASRMGVTVDQLKHMRTLERENENYRRAMEEAQQREQSQQIFNQWMQQAEQVKQIYPTFDFDTEVQNPNFVKLLRSGIDLQTAYQTVHMDDILGGAMAQTAQKVAEKQAANVQARARRPVENGLSNATGVQRKSDVSKLNRQDRRAIAEQVRMGYKISF